MKNSIFLKLIGILLIICFVLSYLIPTESNASLFFSIMALFFLVSGLLCKNQELIMEKLEVNK